MWRHVLISCSAFIPQLLSTRWHNSETCDLAWRVCITPERKDGLGRRPWTEDWEQLLWQWAGVKQTVENCILIVEKLCKRFSWSLFMYVCVLGVEQSQRKILCKVEFLTSTCPFLNVNHGLKYFMEATLKLQNVSEKWENISIGITKMEKWELGTFINYAFSESWNQINLHLGFYQGYLISPHFIFHIRQWYVGIFLWVILFLPRRKTHHMEVMTINI